MPAQGHYVRLHQYRLNSLIFRRFYAAVYPAPSRTRLFSKSLIWLDKVSEPGSAGHTIPLSYCTKIPAQGRDGVENESYICLSLIILISLYSIFRHLSRCFSFGPVAPFTGTIVIRRFGAIAFGAVFFRRALILLRGTAIVRTTTTTL